MNNAKSVFAPAKKSTLSTPVQKLIYTVGFVAKFNVRYSVLRAKNRKIPCTIRITTLAWIHRFDCSNARCENNCDASCVQIMFPWYTVLLMSLIINKMQPALFTRQAQHAIFFIRRAVLGTNQENRESLT